MSMLWRRGFRDWRPIWRLTTLLLTPWCRAAHRRMHKLMASYASPSCAVSLWACRTCHRQWRVVQRRQGHAAPHRHADRQHQRLIG